MEMKKMTPFKVLYIKRIAPRKIQETDKCEVCGEHTLYTTYMLEDYPKGFTYCTTCQPDMEENLCDIVYNL